MLKSFSKSVSLTVLSSLIITQFGCSTPTTAENNVNNGVATNTNPSVTSPQVNNETKLSLSKSSFLLTQKDSKGLKAPIVPENLKSVTINGKVFNTSDISLAKGGFSTKATGELTLSFKDGKYVIEGISDDSQLNISFQLKDTSTPVTIPNTTLSKISGDLRIEVLKNEAGEVTGFTGGINKDGLIDTTQPVFTFDNAAKTLVVIETDGSKTTYEIGDTETQLTVNSKSEVTIDNPEQEIQQTTQDITQPNSVSPFIGMWKFNAFTAVGHLNIIQSTATSIGFNSTIENTIPVFKGTFDGFVKYVETSTVDSLDISSFVNGESIKGNIKLNGDNSLILTLSESNLSEIQPFIGVPLTLERDL